MSRSRLLIACTAALILLSSSRLQAQSAGADKAAADALFDEARALLARGEYGEACAKLEASQALDPGVGTSLNLADCYEKSGRTASAWAQFRDTIAAARKAGSTERERVARERVQSLEPQLSYLTVNTWKGQRVRVARNGTVVDPAVFGTAIPVDPGTHELAASAAGKRPWSTQVVVGEHADRVSVTVPILADETNAELLPSPQPVAAEPPAADSSSGNTLRAIALVSAAVSVAGIATGTVFGLKAASSWSDAKSRCDPYPYCGSAGVKLSEEAQQSGTISTIGFVAGGVGLAAFSVLWLVAPSLPSDESISLAVSPLAISAYGSF